jgi:hypothetical protein
MDYLQPYDPNASASRVSNALRFRSFDSDAKSAAKANKKVPAGAGMRMTQVTWPPSRLRLRRLTNRSGTAGLLRLRRTLHGRCLNPPVVADGADSISFRARRQILLRTERKVTVMTILSLPTDRAYKVGGTGQATGKAAFEGGEW